uniref:Uncharacterized protein n=1 Tax=Avena sativa TaxID=4498 RepID=A0ACD5ZN78_AVESA
MLGRESHADFRTEVLEVEPWSRFPIEKHALSIYTRDIYHRFRLEFELIGRYNVQLVGINMYLLVPNNQTCYPYSGRSYMVNANGGNDNYNCDCCKYERDGLLCCHVLKVFTHVGVDSKRRANSGPTTTAPMAIATNFGNATAVTKKRKTTNSGPTPAAPTPPTSTRTTGWFEADPSNMPPPSSTMAPIDQGHMVEPEEEAMVILDPPRSTTKGRFPSGIELQPKRVIACTLCNQPGHNSATCTAALGSGSLGKKL